MAGSRALLISRDTLSLDYLRTVIAHQGISLTSAPSIEEGIKAISQIPFDFVLVDVVVPNGVWIHALKRMVSLGKETQFIVMAGGKKSDIHETLEKDSIAFIRKPIDIEELTAKLKSHSEKMRQNGTEVKPNVFELTDPPHHQEGYHPQLFFGSSKKMQELKTIIDRVAQTDVTVLIRGESGTGKELVARSIFSKSPRRSRPFLKVLCPAIPEGLLESELFGYEKGSFTGAFRKKPGKFEFANHGTIFLDEIGDIPFSLQAKLLQVLQDGEFSRLGGGNDVKVNVRILAASNMDLEKAVREGSFRGDLFYRLNVVSIYLPPLRERTEDIVPLAKVFLEKHNQQFNKRGDLSEQTYEVFCRHSWPGNIRELENAVKRIVVLGNEKAVADKLASHQEIEYAPLPIDAPVSATAEMRSDSPEEDPDPVDGESTEPICSLKTIGRNAARKAERELIKKILEQTHWNRRETAKILGVSYKALLYKIKECNLNKMP